MKWIIIVLALLALLIGAKLAHSVEASTRAKIARYEAFNPTPREYSIYRVLEEFGGKQWTYFDDLIYRESKWNNLAQNKKSTAYGLAQFLDSTWKLVGCEKTSDPYIQIDCTVAYIKARYGSPEKAIKFHNKHNYY